MSNPMIDDAGRRASPGAPDVELHRTLGLGLLVLYGLGVTVGAGIYVLVGTAAARAGIHAPVAFVVAASVMAFSAASFAELAARFPVSAGEAAFVKAGFRSNAMALVSGLLVVTASVIAAAAISKGAAGYIGVLVPLPPATLTTAVILAMGAVAAWGIKEAVSIAALMTLIEIGGLLVIVGAGLWAQPMILADLPMAANGLGSAEAWSGVLGASLIAFFAFIGFEGMVNVAEEVKRPERTLPLAIAIVLVASTLLYILVVWVVIRSVPQAELAASAAPLSLAYERLTGASPVVISLIAIFATINGVIVQTIMASRVIYGLASQGLLPRVLSKISPLTRTPLRASIVVVAIVLVLALLFPIDRLADMTTWVMLAVFTLVNAALVLLKLREPTAPRGLSFPVWMPIVGMASCVALLVATALS